MHKVYDDEMTFKLVAAASNVSGLPIEVCLEEFGKHFLVYCQKNGYDQILRVLGSNLYDFLTNLDNLHDHLASIYPGMRAPSFRVTHNVDTNRNQTSDTCSVQSQGGSDHGTQTNSNSKLDASMYLHYYSERAGLSPIVKGLVIAVAKEFFQTDITITECHLARPLTPNDSGDDHVVLKIDKRQHSKLAPESNSSIHMELETNRDNESQSRQLKQQEDQRRELQVQSKTMLEIYGSLSSNSKDSLVNSEIMMQTFPFHVIFDRNFKLVQVGKSLLRVTSCFWKGRSDCSDPIKFSDLFDIVRPKIQFTFDAIAGHTNQVFVVKTKPLVLNADQKRSQSEESSFSGTLKAQDDTNNIQELVTVKKPSSGHRMSMCPMDRIAINRQRQRRFSTSFASSEEDALKEDEELKVPINDNIEPRESHSQHEHDDQSDELTSGQHLSLRLKGQMIILTSPNNEPLCLYLCSPRVDHIDQLMEYGVKMSDFALYDRARELMLMSHTHKEDRENVKKLDQATNDLKKMDTKLRQENKRTNEVLHNIFPAKIATLLSHGVKIESESFDPVTCLYSDIIGFTKMCGSENVRPIDIVRLLNTLYLQFDNLTNIHGVFKVETIGDAYVVVGGLPEPAEDHADRCVKMGLDMVKVIATVRSPADNQPIQMRIGIHSGPVMAGIVGIRVPRYSLFGNTTTLANQLETNGVGGKIHISDFTLKCLKKRHEFVIEDNANEISGFPYKTYFVTNYLGDEKETLKYEKILEEQLIKDFQLLGSELALVDCDSYFEEPELRATHAAGVSIEATKDQRAPSEIDRQRLSISEILANQSSTCAADTQTGPESNQRNINTETNSSLRRQSTMVFMDIEGELVKSNCKRDTISHDSTARMMKDQSHQQQQRPQRHQHLQQQRETYINKDQRRAMRQFSSELTGSILSEAYELIKVRRQFNCSKEEKLEMNEILSIFTGDSKSLELIVCKKGNLVDHCTYCCGLSKRGLTDNSILRFNLPMNNESKTIRSSVDKSPNHCQPENFILTLKANENSEDHRPENAFGQLEAKKLSTILSQVATKLSQKLNSSTEQNEESIAMIKDEVSKIIDSQRPAAISSITGNIESQTHKNQELGRLREQLLIEKRNLENKLKRLEEDLGMNLRDPESLAADRESHPTSINTRRLAENLNRHTVTGGARSLIISARGQLSSNIQRMKRMDTLKRRKLKREQNTFEDPLIEVNGVKTGNFLSSIKFDKVNVSTDNHNFLASSGDIIDPTNIHNSKPEKIAIIKELSFENSIDSADDSPEVVDKSSKFLNHSKDDLTKVLDSQQVNGTKSSNPNQRSSGSSSGYNYQSIRASLASLVSEAMNSRHRFSLANVLTSISSTTSPVKQERKNKGFDLTEESRIESSRSHSRVLAGGFGSASTNSPDATKAKNIPDVRNKSSQQESPRKYRNCSCLKSSSSFDSTNDSAP